jgi:hypothetical protein
LVAGQFSRLKSGLEGPERGEAPGGGGIPRARASIIYYVSPTGNDRHTAAQATNRNTPWLTINKALQTIPSTGGVQVEVATGTYREKAGIAINRYFDSPVTIYNPQLKPGQSNVIVLGDADSVITGGISVNAKRAGNIVWKGIQFGDSNYVATNAVLWYSDTKTRLAQMTKLTFQNCRFVSKDANLIYFRSDLPGDSSQGIFDISFENTYFKPGGDTNLILMCPNTPTIAAGRPKNIRFLRCTADIAAPASFSSRVFGDDISVTDCVFSATGESAKALQFGTERATTQNSSERCTNLKISGGTYTSSISHAVLIGGGVVSGRVSGSKVVGGDQGLVLKECQNIMVTGCTILMPERSVAINGLYFKAARNCIATNNWVKGYSRDGGALLAVHNNPVSGNCAADLQVVGNQFDLANDVTATGSCVIWGGPSEDVTSPSGFSSFSENVFTKSKGSYGIFYGNPFTSLRSLSGIRYPTGSQGAKSVFL